MKTLIDQLPKAGEFDRNYHQVRPIYDVANGKLHYQTEPFVEDGVIKVKRLASYDVVVEQVHQVVEEYTVRTNYTPVEVKVLRAIKGSPGDPVESISYDLQHVRKEFSGIDFELGAWYIFTHKSGQKIAMKRNQKRFYSGKLENVKMMFARNNQERVFHEIISVEKAK